MYVVLQSKRIIGVRGGIGMRLRKGKGEGKRE